MTADLVEIALQMAKKLRQDPPENIIFRSDRGTPYAGDQTRAYTKDWKTRSIGQTGV